MAAGANGYQILSRGVAPAPDDGRFSGGRRRASQRRLGLRR